MKLFGVKQQCQDIVCPGTDCNWEPECMSKCHYDKSDAIYSCCEEECGSIGANRGYDDCMSSCHTEKKKKKADVPVLLIIGLFSVFFILVLLFLFYNN